METVIVLMATYNGEKYLKEQLLSILNQTGVKVELVIRDDGSTDGTEKIVRGFMDEFTNISFISGRNVGSAMNFYELAKHVSGREANFYAFADQDDIWYEDKLWAGLQLIGNKEKPALYFSELDLMDAEGNIVGRGINRKSFEVNRRCALVQNQAAGCTMVFNKKALDILVKHRPVMIQMHDFWMFILMSFLGSIYYDPEAHMGYRQHGNNVVGADMGLCSRWKSRIRYIKRLKEHPREDMAKELLAGYKDDLTDEDVELISKVAYYRQNIRKRLGLLFDRTIHMLDRERDFWYRIRIIFGDI